MTTPAPLVWDYYRSAGAVDGLGGNVHYYEQSAQALYLNDGIATQTTKVISGQWEDAVYGDEIVLDDTAYTILSVDHPHNGTLHMIATDGSALYYLRYVYAMEVGDIVASGKWTAQSDSAVTQASLTLKNISEETFAGLSTLFNPGAKYTLAATVGDSDPYPIGAGYLDEARYNPQSSTVPVSGRNTIGYRLLESTFDENTVFDTGYSHEKAAEILELGGVTDYDIEVGSGTASFTFEPDQTLFSGLTDDMFKWYYGWKLLELPDGKVIIGYDNWIKSNYQQNSYYTFNLGKDAFKRETDKSADGAYSRVMVQGADGDGLTPVIVDVNKFAFWSIPAHKTYHATAPAGFTQADLQAYAEDLAATLQYIGIGEQFTGPFRPHLLVGDVAAIYNTGDAEAVSLGVITGVTHTFGEKGFQTDFSVDSGGVVTDGANYTVVSRVAKVGGFNRRQRIMDIIKNAVKGG